jgi:hypothetical protein
MSLTSGSPISREYAQTVANRQVHLPHTHAIWQKAWHAPNGASLESICAKIACVVFPIILMIAAGEGIIHIGRLIWDKCQRSFIPSHIRPGPPYPPNPLLRPSIQTVQLNRGSSQYDIAPGQYDPNNERPPACTFHALQAIPVIARNFDRWANCIQANDAAWLSSIQRDLVSEGLRYYRQAVALDPTFQQGADLEHIRNRFPQYLVQFQFQNTNQEMHPVPVRVQTMANWLFSADNQKRIVWIKTHNEESFAVVCDQGRAIVFDSHKNEVTMARGKEQLQGFLTNKLLPFSQMMGGVDLNAFSYALGRIG